MALPPLLQQAFYAAALLVFVLLAAQSRRTRICRTKEKGITQKANEKRETHRDDIAIIADEATRHTRFDG